MLDWKLQPLCRKTPFFPVAQLLEIAMMITGKQINFIPICRCLYSYLQFYHYVISSLFFHIHISSLILSGALYFLPPLFTRSLSTHLFFISIITNQLFHRYSYISLVLFFLHDLHFHYSKDIGILIQQHFSSVLMNRYRFVTSP